MSMVDSAMLDDWNVSASLRSRTLSQRGRPNLDLSLCGIVDKLPLEVIRHYYGELTSVSSLYLQYNQIRSLPSCVSELSRIQVLDLDNNQLERLPEDFGKLEQLVYLDIHKNKLQSLPLSMGKMTRLTYLNLSDNPFGPPLRDFLELEKQRLNGDVIVTHIAQLVVNFLAKIHPEALTFGSGDQPLVRRRAVTFQNDREMRKDTSTKPEITVKICASIIITETEDDSTESFETTQRKLEPPESDLILGPHMPQTAHKYLGQRLVPRRRRSGQHAKAVLLSTEDDWNLFKVYGAVLLLIWLAMCPVMMALIFETSAVDQFVKESDFFSSIWKSCRPLHEAIENWINYFQIDSAMKVRGPSLEVVHEYQNVDPFTAMFLAFQKALAELFKIVVEFGQ